MNSTSKQSVHTSGSILQSPTTLVSPVPVLSTNLTETDIVAESPSVKDGDKLLENPPLSKSTNSMWLDAFDTAVSDITTLPSCILITDWETPLEYDMVILDLSPVLRLNKKNTSRLKFYKGFHIQIIHDLEDCPASLCEYRNSSSEKEPTLVMVGCIRGSLWGYSKGYPILQFELQALDPGLTLSDQQASVTAMISMKKGIKDDRAPDVLVLATEQQVVYIVDIVRDLLLEQFQLSCPVTLIGAFGSYETNFRLLVICRDGEVHLLKRNTSFKILQLEFPAISLLVTEKTFLVATINNRITSYQFSVNEQASTNNKGTTGGPPGQPLTMTSVTCSPQYSIFTPASILSMEKYSYRAKRFHGFMVSLDNKQVRLYYENQMVSQMDLPCSVTSLKTGNIGKEPGGVMLIGSDGSLRVKILRRNAELDFEEAISGPQPEQLIPLHIGRKTKAYLEQTMLEKENAVDINRLFQASLAQVKLLAANTFSRAITLVLDPISSQTKSKIKLEMDLKGLGPIFHIISYVENLGEFPADNLMLVYSFNTLEYEMKMPCSKLPRMIPGYKYTFDSSLAVSQDYQGSGLLSISLVNWKHSTILVRGTIEVPESQSFLDQL